MVVTGDQVEAVATEVAKVAMVKVSHRVKRPRRAHWLTEQMQTAPMAVATAASLSSSSKAAGRDSTESLYALFSSFLYLLAYKSWHKDTLASGANEGSRPWVLSCNFSAR